MSRSVIEHCVVADGAALVSLRRLEESVQAHPEALREPVTVADLNLARAAVAASVKSWDLTKQALADMGRAGLPKDERLHFYALAAHEVLAQVSMRGGQRAEAFRLLTEASSIAKDLEAWAEYANHQAILAAYGVRMGSFDSALLHAQDTMTAVQRSGVTHARVSPWLGVGFDLAVERDFAGVVRALAEAVNTNLKIGDRYGYLVAACAMVAMYLAADRAAEGLDALNEAISAVDEQADPSGAAILREVSEKLLRFIGLLQ